MFQKSLKITFFGIAVAAATPALAQSAGWDGTWVGTTAKGGAVSITIAGSSAQYNFRGEDVPVNQVGGSGKSFQLDVGTGHGMVKLMMSGPTKAKYSYKGPDGGSATATLMKQ